MFIGTLASLSEKLERLREELGITSFMLGELEDMAPLVERLSGT